MNIYFELGTKVKRNLFKNIMLINKQDYLEHPEEIWH